MNDAPPSHAPIRFGVFELDAESGELRKQGVKIRLQEQPFQILQVLLEHPGRVVTREELQQRVWSSDTFVDFDTGVYNAIKKLREALGDSAENPRFIETLSRRGYRFIATVNGNGRTTTVEAAAPVATKPESPRTVRIGASLGIAMTILLGTLLGLGMYWQQFSGSAPAPPIRSIAVLPLENLSGDPAQEYFSDGMTDALITDLAQIGSVRVISRTSSMQYKQTKKSLPEIARELNVDGILEGTVQRSGDRVRITAQLIQGSSDKHVWANSYERDMRDIFALEREVTSDIARHVQARLAADKEAGLTQLKPINPQALEAYLQGNFHLRKGDNRSRDEEYRKAAEYFQRAINADPMFASAYTGLAEAHEDLFWPSTEDFAMMRAASEKALELAPISSDAHDAVAQTKLDDKNWAGAEAEYRRAIELNPSNASAHHGLGKCLDRTGRMDEGWKEFQIAQEVDPNQDHLSEALYRRGEYNRALELLLRTTELRPEDTLAHWDLSENYARQGRHKEWVQEVGTMLTIFGFRGPADRIRRAFASSGYTGALRQWAVEMKHIMAKKQGYFPGVLAETFAARGDNDQAFYWLGQGCQHYHQAISDPVLPGVKVDPGFASLHSDPRFKDVLRCMGLPP